MSATHYLQTEGNEGNEKIFTPQSRGFVVPFRGGTNGNARRLFPSVDGGEINE